MGFKLIKDHYNIPHIVHLRKGNLCIGSAYITEIIVVRPDGSFVKGETETFRNEDLDRVRNAIAANRKLFVCAFAMPDDFEMVQPVFTVEDGRIRRYLCEQYGWPNTTTCGKLMYHNTFFETRKEAKRYALRDTSLGLKEGFGVIARAFGDSTRQIKKGFRYFFQQLRAYTVARFLN
jgi:hypothetical protein